MAEQVKKPRGFAAMSKEKAAAIQSLGGQKSPTNFKYMEPHVRKEMGAKGGSARRKV